MKVMRPSRVGTRPQFYARDRAALRRRTGVTRAGNLFTTHTAVAAGFDRFAPVLIEQYLAGYAKRSSASRATICWRWAARTRTTRRKVSTWLIWRSGEQGGQWRESFAWYSEPAHFYSSLSALAGEEVPVGHVTNGVHMPSWDSAAAMISDGGVRKDRWLGMAETLEQDIRAVSDDSSGDFAPPPARLLLNTLANNCLNNWLPLARHPRRLKRRGTCSILTH